MVYKLKLFALLKERVGADVWRWERPGRVTGSMLLAAFFDANPSLESLRTVTRLAVNQEFCNADVTVTPDDELALIPPVSGG